MAMDCKNFGEAVYIRDNIAVAIDYGYFRNADHAFDVSPLKVLFIDMSATATTLTLVEYSKVSHCLFSHVESN